MDVPLYATTFAFVFNKGVYGQMSAAQKKVIDDHCTNEWSGKVAGPWADFEHAGVLKLKADSAREVYPISAEQVALWRKAAEPLQGVWAENVRKAGGDPDAAFKELKASLGQFSAGY
jgi:TRAP-type C4-dicarboxylate transport system substrate-binding protein